MGTNRNGGRQCQDTRIGACGRPSERSRRLARREKLRKGIDCYVDQGVGGWIGEEGAPVSHSWKEGTSAVNAQSVNELPLLLGGQRGVAMRHEICGGRRAAAPDRLDRLRTYFPASGNPRGCFDQAYWPPYKGIAHATGRWSVRVSVRHTDTSATRGSVM